MVGGWEYLIGSGEYSGVLRHRRKLQRGVVGMGLRLWEFGIMRSRWHTVTSLTSCCHWPFCMS